MNLIDETDIGMPHLECALEFGRQKALEAGFSSFNRDPCFAPLIEGFIHDTHSAFPNFTKDLKPLRDILSSPERRPKVFEGDQRVLEEVAHPLLPAYRFHGFSIELSVFRAGEPQVKFTLGRGPSQRSRDNTHHTAVVFCTAFHGSCAVRPNVRL